MHLSPTGRLPGYPSARQNDSFVVGHGAGHRELYLLPGSLAADEQHHTEVSPGRPSCVSRGY